jgi:hypothetical protein
MIVLDEDRFNLFETAAGFLLAGPGASLRNFSLTRLFRAGRVRVIFSRWESKRGA